MAHKWRQRGSYFEDDEEEGSQVKSTSAPSSQSSQSHHSKDDEESSSSKREKSSHGKHKHKHHHKKHKKDRRRSRSKSRSRSRSKSPSRSHEKESRSKEQISWRLQGTSNQVYRENKDRHESNRAATLPGYSHHKSSKSYRSRDRSDFRRSDKQRNDNKSSDIDDSPIQPFNPKKLPIEATKLKEEIEKRKLLWSKKDKPAAEVITASPWKRPAFNDDNDGKVSAKFKRLMGIKEDDSKSATAAAKSSSESSSARGDEYFADLEKQYEVARATTHTQRGLGLGFSSSTRLLPR